MCGCVNAFLSQPFESSAVATRMEMRLRNKEDCSPSARCNEKSANSSLSAITFLLLSYFSHVRCQLQPLCLNVLEGLRPAPACAENERRAFVRFGLSAVEKPDGNIIMRSSYQCSIAKKLSKPHSQTDRDVTIEFLDVLVSVLSW